jgi:pimeloyl-ACP methyl ester carboxylesterase
VSASDVRLLLPNLTLAARDWGPSTGSPVLALHGWLDNSASFDRLAPLLDGLRIVAVDLPGHGRSDRLPAACGHHFADWPALVLAAIDALGWDRFSVIGHSMGAGISTLLPAVAPDRVDRLVLLEGFGPLSDPADAAAEGLASALEQEQRLASAEPRVFPDLDAAVEARRSKSDLDATSARLLVERGVERVAGGVVFTHDPRLKSRSRARFTEGQVQAFLRRIRCPVLAVRASNGWPFPEDLVAARTAVISDLTVARVEGGHHVHLTNPDRVAPVVADFLSTHPAG